MATDQQVKAANRRLYDEVADSYEQIDGRRSPALEGWLRGRLAKLRERAPGGRLLDLGAGSGLITRCAQGIFSQRIGIDISPRMLQANRGSFDWGVAADADRLPFRDRSFDAITCFAVLHHLFGFEQLVPEIARVLRPGGVLYSDHDMDTLFAHRFRLPLGLYRRMNDAGARYRRASDTITREL